MNKPQWQERISKINYQTSNKKQQMIFEAYQNKLFQIIAEEMEKQRNEVIDECWAIYASESPIVIKEVDEALQELKTKQ